MKKIEVLKIILSLLVIIIVYFYLDYNNTFKVLSEISIYNFLIIIGLNFLGYVCTGYQTHYMIKTQNRKGISLQDIVFLPITMSLFAHIIPTNGGVIYSTYYLKSKYQIKASSGFALGVVLIYISFIVTGVFGVLTYYFIEEVTFVILVLSILLFFTPVLVFYSNSFIQKRIQFENSILSRIKTFINELVVSANNLMKDFKVVTVNILITLIYLGLTYITFYLINDLIGMGVSESGVFLILVITRVSSLIRILPGNIGVQELFLSGFFEFIGSTAAMGLIFSLICRLAIIVLFIPLGILHFSLNSHFMSLKELKKQIKKS